MEKQNRSFLDWLVISTILLVFLSVSFYTIGDYGLTYDFTFHYSRGEAYLHYFLTGNKDYSDIPEKDRCMFQDISFDDILVGKTREVSPGWSNGEFGAHPSLSGLLSALGCTVFNRKLKLFNVIDAHHSINIILAAITILIVYLFALETNGPLVATLAALSLALLPRFIGHLTNNFKDIPIVCFSTLSIWAFWKGIKKLDWRWIFLFAIFFGLSMSVKFNAVWIVLTVGLWLIFQWKPVVRSGSKSLWFSLAMCPLIAFLIFYLLWPYLWTGFADRLSGILGHYSGYVTRKSPIGAEFASKGSWRPYYAPAYVLITTPVILLLFSIIGLITGFKNVRKERHKNSLFVILWLFSPIILFMSPGLFVYNGIRQFMGFVAPFCIVAAIGAKHAIELLRTNYFNKSNAAIISFSVSAIMIMPLVVVNIQTHPNQITYFNLLVGGLDGAQKVRIPLTNRVGIPDAWDYWGSSYRNGVKWLNENAEPNSLLTIFFAKHVVVGAEELRKDIEFTKIDSLEQVKDGKHSKPGYIMFITNRWFLEYNEIVKYCYNNLTPAYSIISQGAPVLLIYKY